MGVVLAINDRLKALVEKSIDQYAEMVGLLGELDQRMSDRSVRSIEQFNTAFNILQLKIQNVDRQVIELLSREDPPDSVRRLLTYRKIQQQQALQLLKGAEPRARSVKSLLASEMQSLKLGRMALSGYKNGSVRQGTIINQKR